MPGATVTDAGRAVRSPRARAFAALAALAALSSSSGCGSDGASGPADLAARDPGGDPLDAAVASERDLAAGPSGLGDLARIVDLIEPYPPGPYGAEEGDVPPNFTWKGYLDLTGEWPADRLPLTDVSLQQLRLADGRYLFIATGAYW